MKEALSVRELCFAYDDKVVLEDISFDVRPSEIVCVLGPNASGKTTLLKNLAGLLTPQSGEMEMGGRSLSTLSHQERARRIGFVPQQEEIFLPFTVEQIVLMGRAPYLGLWGFEGEDDLKAVKDSMEATRVMPLRERSLEELSGGERQRVLIARALAQQADILLLDEPTSHLDVRYQKEILELCVSLRDERGLTVVMSLHDLNLAALYSQRVLLLKNGRLAGIGAPQDILTENSIEKVFETRMRVSRDVKSGLPSCVPIR